MTDLCHSRGPLVRGGLAANQLVLQVDLHHFAHQAICRPANRSNLLQDCHAGFARLQRALEGFNPPRMRRTRLSARFYLQVNVARLRLRII